MRNLLTILLFGCVLFLTAGYSLVYTIRRAEVRTEVRETIKQLHRRDLIPLSFSNAEAATIQWEDDHEFRYQGEMYDVVDTETAGSKIVYWCINDEKETLLIDAFLKAQKNSQNSGSTTLAKLLQVPFLPAPPLVMTTRQENFLKHHDTFCVVLQQAGADVLLPPPRFS